MSSTPSKRLRGRVAKLYARRHSAYRSSTDHGCCEHMATICWASTSSGLRGTRVDSLAPSSMRPTTTADSNRPPRYLVKIFPDLISPTVSPDRPLRCTPLPPPLRHSTSLPHP